MTLPILHLAATLFMTGVIVFVQVVHDPLMTLVGEPGYQACQKAHMRRTTWLVFPAMTVVLATAVGLAVLRWGTPDAPLALVGLGLLGII